MLARVVPVALVAALALALVPDLGWTFQLVYPLALAFGAVTTTWWPAIGVLVLPLWAGADYALDPYEDSDSIDSSGGAALLALATLVPIVLATFAAGRLIRAIALGLGTRRSL